MALHTVAGNEAVQEVRERLRNNIRALMGVHRVSGVRLGALVGLTQTQVSQRLNGKVPFDEDELVAVAAAFGRDIADLYAEGMSINPMYSHALSSLSLEGVHSLHLFDPTFPDNRWNTKAEVEPVPDLCSDSTQVEPATRRLGWREAELSVGVG